MFMLFAFFMSVAQAQNCSLAARAQTLEDILMDKQYPEERVYTSTDRGFRQYGAPSMHGTNRIALTFDDGPHEIHTPKLLDVLKEYNVKTTFFVVTRLINARTTPILIRALKEGHILASHSTDHANSNEIDEVAFKQSLKTSLLKLKEVYDAAGMDWQAIYFRYPYAAYGNRRDYHQMNVMQQVSQELFGDNCVQFAFWDIDTADWVADMTAADVAQNLKANFEGGRAYEFESYRDARGRLLYRKVPITIRSPLKGGVALQHDIHQKNIEGTRTFLEYAKQNGIELTTLPEIEEFKVLRDCRFLK
jgi:peptidoglycan-N-acetylglucosamine deacetylase